MGDRGSWARRIVGEDPRDVGEEPDARFTFANERTFLAWIRTALALISVGLAITQLLPPFEFTGGRRIIGLPLIVFGIVTAIAAWRAWAGNERALRLQQALPRSSLGLFLTLMIAAVGVIALVVAIGWGTG